MQETYETGRLILRILDKTYANPVLDYYLRNQEFLKEWDVLRGDEFYAKDFQEKLLEEDIINTVKGRLLKLWVFKSNDINRVIGSVTFNNIVRGAFLSCHLGYKLDKDEVNQGYIMEAIQKGIDIIFNEYKLHRIESNIMPKNKPSLRVVEKLGFYNEGMAYKYLKINGRWEDHIHMVLLNDKM